MTRARTESSFAEVQLDSLIIESFPNEASAYFKTEAETRRDRELDRFRSRLRWHLSRSLSPRQKQVMRLILEGKRQREIAFILGIKQQVVSIYKRRAINKLRNLLI